MTKPGGGKMERLIDRIEWGVMIVLIWTMIAVVILSTVDLGWNLVHFLATGPVSLLDPERLLDAFGIFLLVLIGVELLETLRSFMRDRVLRAEIILLVAIIALARKIIILEAKTTSPGTMLGIAALVAALGATYWLIRQSHRRGADEP